jgi:Fe-S cluster assembly ATP-binding protein
MLSIENLHVSIGGKSILKGLTLDLPKGEVHAIMGPNGAGKSTLSYTLAGRAGYEVTEGSATLYGEDLLGLSPDDRAAKGVFLSFQYPLEIPGVPAITFVRAALNAQRKARGEEEIGPRVLEARPGRSRRAEGGFRDVAPRPERRLLGR